jgi:hypothetical protein
VILVGGEASTNNRRNWKVTREKTEEDHNMESYVRLSIELTKAATLVNYNEMI